MGPNDAKRVVWAIQEFFIYLFHVLLLLTSVFRYYLSTGRLRYTETTKTGPNDVRRVVWAIHRFFLSFFSCFTYTDKCTLLYTFVHFCALKIQYLLLLTFWALYHKQTLGIVTGLGTRAGCGQGQVGVGVRVGILNPPQNPHPWQGLTGLSRVHYPPFFLKILLLVHKYIILKRREMRRLGFFLSSPDSMSYIQ